MSNTSRRSVSLARLRQRLLVCLVAGALLVAVLALTQSVASVHAASAGDGTGELVVTAQDANGELVQQGHIVLYDEEWNPVGDKSLDADGQVQWLNLAAGTYHIELYRTQDLFWGGRDATVSAGDRTEVTVRRLEPYATNLEVTETEQDGTYRVGETTTISPEIRNDRSFLRTVRVKIAVSAGGDSPPDESVTRGPLEIAGGESEWYGYEYTPTQAGPVTIRITVQSRIADSWVTTDTTEWTDAVTVQEESTPTPQDQSTPAPQNREEPTPQQTGGTSDGLGQNIYLLTGLVVAAVLGGLYAASKMTW